MKSVTTIVNMKLEKWIENRSDLFFPAKKKNRRDLFSKRCLSNKYFFKIMLFTGGGRKKSERKRKIFSESAAFSRGSFVVDFLTRLHWRTSSAKRRRRKKKKKKKREERVGVEGNGAKRKLETRRSVRRKPAEEHRERRRNRTPRPLVYLIAASHGELVS